MTALMLSFTMLILILLGFYVESLPKRMLYALLSQYLTLGDLAQFI